MKIMVFDVPAESGGALTILKQYYDRAINDSKNDWIFVVSTPDLIETKNVKVIKYPWVKKSWLHRLYFDKFIAKKLVEKNSVDEVLSLQNIIIKNLNVKQTLYLHQSLPFIEKRYNINENLKFWVYQNIISTMIFKSIEEADKVIVQTKWMKKACMEKVKVDSKKLVLEQPIINVKVNKLYKQENQNSPLFFYPANGSEYKNHRIIVEAVRELANRSIKCFRVVFTLKGDENKNIKKLYDTVRKENLSIDFIGKIPIEEVYEYYSKSVLIFPSYIETFGLPMLEAKIHNAPVLASDCAFAHEILDNYGRVGYFNPFDKSELFELMKAIIDGKRYCI